jgi:hypothetical protein
MSGMAVQQFLEIAPREPVGIRVFLSDWPAEFIELFADLALKRPIENKIE